VSARAVDPALGMAATASALTARQRRLGNAERLDLARAALRSEDAGLRAAIADFLDAHVDDPAGAGAALQDYVLRRIAVPDDDAWAVRADING